MDKAAWIVIPFLVWLLLSASHGSNTIVNNDTEEFQCTVTYCPTSSR